MKIGVTLEALPGDVQAMICEGQERADAAAKSDRADTVSIWATDGAGGLIGYCVLGFDADDMVTIYQARAYVSGMGAIAFRALIGAADVLGAPVRVHAKRIAPMLRMGQVQAALQAVDLDGLPMGIFGHGV